MLLFDSPSAVVVVVLWTSNATTVAVLNARIESTSGLKYSMVLVLGAIFLGGGSLSMIEDAELRVDFSPLTSKCSVPNLEGFTAKLKQS